MIQEAIRQLIQDHWQIEYRPGYRHYPFIFRDDRIILFVEGDAIFFGDPDFLEKLKKFMGPFEQNYD